MCPEPPPAAGRSGCCRCEAAEPGLWEHDTRAVFVPLLLSHSDSNLARSLAACVCTRHRVGVEVA